MAEETEPRALLGWRWDVQQAIWHDLIAPGENEWTTWSDAITITEHVAAVLAAKGYVVVQGPPDFGATREADDE